MLGSVGTAYLLVPGHVSTHILEATHVAHVSAHAQGFPVAEQSNYGTRYYRHVLKRDGPPGLFKKNVDNADAMALVRKVHEARQG